jgi:hypothetical protein
MAPRPIVSGIGEIWPVSRAGPQNIIVAKKAQRITRVSEVRSSFFKIYLSKILLIEPSTAAKTVRKIQLITLLFLFF